MGMRRWSGAALAATMRVSMGLAGAAAPLALSGCTVTNVASSRMTEGTTSSRVAHVAGTPLVVRNANGAVRVQRGGGSEVVVDARIRARDAARLAATSVSSVRDADGTLRVGVVWPNNQRESTEGASLIVTVPDTASLDIETSNGAITIEGGLAGPASLDTSNGAITVRDYQGPVNADTSNGAVELTNVPAADVDTSNGSVKIVLAADATGPVRADSSNGSIELVVGAGFTGSVDADTSNGRVSCAVPRAAVVRQRNSSAFYRFGEGATSTLSTSNGSITIRGE